MPPALVVESFDIPRGAKDRRLLALEDVCSVLELPTSAKYDGTVQPVVRGLRPLSTDPSADTETEFRRALFPSLIGDGDIYLKNLALLKSASPKRKASVARSTHHTVTAAKDLVVPR